MMPTALGVQANIGAHRWVFAFWSDSKQFAGGFVFALSTAEKFLSSDSSKGIVIGAGDSILKRSWLVRLFNAVLLGMVGGSLGSERNTLTSLWKVSIRMALEQCWPIQTALAFSFFRSRRSLCFFEMDGRAVFDFCNVMLLDRSKKPLKMVHRASELDYLLFHQANIRILIRWLRRSV